MKSNVEWEKWGEKDPLFAVATWPGKEKDGANPWTDEEFYALGRSDGESFLTAWNSFGCDRRHLLEIGCGAGRLTRFFATCFDQVSAVDVSEHQIAYARSRIDQDHVRFFKTDGDGLPLKDGEATAVFSAQVFQHFNSREDIARIFREIHRVLAPGGTLMIHLPLYSLPNNSLAPLLRGLIDIYGQLAQAKAWLARKRGKLIMRMLVSDRAWLISFLAELGFRRIEFRGLDMNSKDSGHDFVFAQK